MFSIMFSCSRIHFVILCFFFFSVFGALIFRLIRCSLCFEFLHAFISSVLLLFRVHHVFFNFFTYPFIHVFLHC